VAVIVIVEYADWSPGRAQGSFGLFLMVSAAIDSLVQFLLGALLVVLASRLFQALANRVLQPAGGRSPLDP